MSTPVLVQYIGDCARHPPRSAGWPRRLDLLPPSSESQGHHVPPCPAGSWPDGQRSPLLPRRGVLSLRDEGGSKTGVYGATMNLERGTGLEPATTCLEGTRSPHKTGLIVNPSDSKNGTKDRVDSRVCGRPQASLLRSSQTFPHPISRAEPLIRPRCLLRSIRGLTVVVIPES